MLAGDTNARRFHYLTGHQRTHRLSTAAFDRPTLYGIDSDGMGSSENRGGGVAIDTSRTCRRLCDRLISASPNFSASMTISGPRQSSWRVHRSESAVLARKLYPKLRGNSGGHLQRSQAQNETIFPIEASLRFSPTWSNSPLANVARGIRFRSARYHLAKASSDASQQRRLYALNGFAYAEMFAARGSTMDQFGPRLSFFLRLRPRHRNTSRWLACRSRRLAIGMRDVFAAGTAAQRERNSHTDQRPLANRSRIQKPITRTAAELNARFYMNATNSCHSNSADEPFTTPSEEWIRLAAHGPAILLEESGIFKHTMNMLSGSPGMKAVERAVEAAILDEFREIERLGGVLAAVEDRYQRSQIQNAAHRYEQQIYNGTRPIIGLNRYRDGGEEIPEVKLARTPRKKQQLQVDRLAKFKKKNAEKTKRALDKLADVVEHGENCFPMLLEAVEVCSLGQIAGRLQEVVGRFRPMV